MVEMRTIRKEGFTGEPFLLGADTLTEAVATAIPSADREEKVSSTDRGSHIVPGNARSSGDAVQFVALMRHLRPLVGLAANLMFEIAITKYPGRAARRA
jgi:hypothetical protein